MKDKKAEEIRQEMDESFTEVRELWSRLSPNETSSIQRYIKARVNLELHARYYRDAFWGRIGAGLIGGLILVLFYALYGYGVTIDQVTSWQTRIYDIEQKCINKVLGETP